MPAHKKIRTPQQIIDEENAVPFALKIKRHYRKIGIYRGFGRERFYNLCRLTQCLPIEIAAIMGLRPHKLQAFLDEDKFDGPSTLHLLIMEDAFKTLRYEDHVPIIVTPWHLLIRKKKVEYEPDYQI